MRRPDLSQLLPTPTRTVEVGAVDRGDAIIIRDALARGQAVDEAERTRLVCWMNYVLARADRAEKTPETKRPWWQR